MQWLAQYAATIQAASSILMVLIWLVYLNFFLLGFHRQRRPELLISAGAGRGLDARIFVTNLGIEPVYVLDVVMHRWSEDGGIRADVTELLQDQDDGCWEVSTATRQGPLKSGDSKDFGSFRDLFRDADLTSRDDEPRGSICLTVIAAAASTARIFGAYRTFDMIPASPVLRIVPLHVETCQVRSWSGRRHLNAEIRHSLYDQRSDAQRP